MKTDEFVWAVSTKDTTDWFQVEKVSVNDCPALFRCQYYSDSQNLEVAFYTYRTYAELMCPGAFRFYHSVYQMRRFEFNLDK